MSSEPPPSQTDEDFFAIAADLGLLERQDIETLRSQCSSSGASPARFVTERNLLDAIEADIVETLASPDHAIPGYRVLRLIGRGGMGVVYCAEQQNLGRTVALKTILVSRMSDRSMLDRFELEARTIGQLRHPNIIAAHDFGRHSGRLYLAMELVEGTDLDQRLKSGGALDEHTAWNLARQTAAGLAHAAQKHIVHRDIKPANLILVPPPEGYPLPPGLPMVKIADFGLALLQDNLDRRTRLTEENATLGSPHYMAPEQLESSNVDGRADMYSLGATVYHALAGRPPFAGLKLSQLIAAKLGEGPPPLSEICPGLEPVTYRLVHRLLARNPAERPATYAELLAEIDETLQNVHTVVIPVTGSSGAVSRLEGETANEQTDHLRAAKTEVDLEASSHAQAPAPPSSANWRRRGVLSAMAAGLLLAIGWGAMRGTSRPPLPQRPVSTEQTGPAVHLFNGRNTLGWEVRNGDWVGVPEEAVLTASQGVIGHGLFVHGTGSRPRGLANYHLEALMHPLEGDAATRTESLQEVHFGLVAVEGRNGPRYVVQRSAEGIRVGERNSDSGNFQPEDRIPSRPLAAEQAAALTIDCVPNGWFLQLNGEPLAALPRRQQSELPEIRLKVDQGPARFSDLMVTELVPLAPDKD
jgi:serine/threonine protein kinase